MTEPPEPDHGEGRHARPGLTASAIAVAVGGTIRGDERATVHGVAPLDRASPEDLSFLATARYASLFAGSRAGVVLMSPDLAQTAGGAARARIVVADPHAALLALLPRLHPPAAHRPGIHHTAQIGRGVVLGRDVALGPGAVVGDGARLGDRVVLGQHAVIGEGVTIGDDSRLFAHATAYPNTTIGARVIVHAGARLGSDGFGYHYADGAHRKIPHVGRCIIEDDVEIGANTTIDRGSIDDTVVGAGTKIDNLVHIAHNVRIGRLCLLMAQVGIAGSVRIEDGCVLAGQSGIAGHRTIGRGAKLAAKAGAFGDIPAGETWSGYPARPHTEVLRAQAALFKLAGMIRKLERLIGGGGQSDEGGSPK